MRVASKNIPAFKPAVQEQPVKLNGQVAATILRWDGGSSSALLDAQFTDFDGIGGYSGAQIPIAPGTRTASSSQPIEVRVAKAGQGTFAGMVR